MPGTTESSTQSQERDSKSIDKEATTDKEANDETQYSYAAITVCNPGSLNPDITLHSNMRAGNPAQNGPSHSPTGVGNPVDDGGTEVEYAYTTVTPDPILRYCPNLNSKKNDTGKGSTKTSKQGKLVKFQQGKISPTQFQNKIITLLIGNMNWLLLLPLLFHVIQICRNPVNQQHQEVPTQR